MSARIEGMNKEDLLRLVNFLYYEKKLDEVVNEYLDFAPPVKVQLSIEWLHANVCVLSHPPCDFYAEEEQVDTWLAAHHRYWMVTYEDIRTRCNITDAEFTSCIDTVRYLQGEVARRKEWKPDPRLFLYELLKLRPDLLSPVLRTTEDPALPFESSDEFVGTEEELVQLLETGPQAQ